MMITQRMPQNTVFIASIAALFDALRPVLQAQRWFAQISRTQDVNMAHVLAKMTGVPIENIKRQLETDAVEHAREGLFLEDLWQNSENPAEVLFLFRVADLAHCPKLMNTGTLKRAGKARPCSCPR
jgi:hypothetical protein